MRSRGPTGVPTREIPRSQRGAPTRLALRRVTLPVQYGTGLRALTIDSGPLHHSNSHIVTAKQIPLGRRDVGPAFRSQGDLFNVPADRCAGNSRPTIQQSCSSDASAVPLADLQRD